MKQLLLTIWADDSGFDLLEYAVAAVVLTAILVVAESMDIHGSDLLANLGIRAHHIVR